MSNTIYFKRDLTSLVYEQVTPTEITEAIVNEIEQLHEARDGWEKHSLAQIATERDRLWALLTQAERRAEVLEDERNKWHIGWKRISAELLNERRHNARQLANIREAVVWLWGFWDGNSLRAIPGFEDDIRDAWDRLLAAYKE